MTTSTDPPPADTGPDVPRFSVAGVFLEGLASQDFDRLATALSPDVRMRSLLPRGLVEWTGTAEVRSAFTRWFGDTEDFEVVDAAVGEVGSRLHLRWRARIRADRIGPGSHVVEQQAYVDTGAGDRIVDISLLCSGYCPEQTHV